jgi:hypothetical protein
MQLNLDLAWLNVVDHEPWLLEMKQKSKAILQDRAECARLGCFCPALLAASEYEITM